jgi:hypothetical protein
MGVTLVMWVYLEVLQIIIEKQGAAAPKSKIVKLVNSKRSGVCKWVFKFAMWMYLEV